MRSTFLSLLCLLHVAVAAQTVDEVRLSYDVANLKAKQLSAAASADGKYLAFAYNDGNVRIFDLAARKFKAVVKTPLEEFHDLRLTNDGKLVTTAFSDMKIYNWKTGEELKSFKLAARYARSDFNPTHNILVYGMMGGNFASFDLNALTEMHRVKMGGMMINALALDADAKSAVASFYKMGGKYPLKQFDIRTGEVKKEFDKEIYHALALDLKGNLMAYGWGAAGTFFFHIYDKNYQLVKKFETPTQKYGYVDAAFSGSKIVFTTASLTLDAYDIEEEKLVYTSMADRSLMKIVGNYAYPKVVRLNDTKFMFSYGNDNICRIYDATTNNVVAYFYNNGENESCVVAKDGRIDGDMDALTSVSWTSRKSKTLTPLERTFERGFTPNLFNIIVAENHVAQRDFDIDAVAGSMPAVEIVNINGSPFKEGSTVTSIQKNIKLDVAVSGNVADLGEVRLYHNGKLLKPAPSAGTGKYTFDVSLNNSFGKENYLAAVGLTKAGIETEKRKVIVSYTGSSDAKPKVFLVTIGINAYKNPKYNLNYAMADANGVQEAMQNLPSTLFSEVIQYAIRNDNAVKENIVKTLAEVKEKALEQDLLVVYYAGHGLVSDHSGTSEFFLAMHDVTQLYGRPEILQEKALSASEVRQLTQDINAQKQLFLLDACQSGAALESAVAKRGVEEERAIAQLARSTGTFWITASGSTQFATEIEALGHGIFTYALLEGLAGKADGNKDGKLTVRELSVYIEDEVPMLTEKYKGTAQYPSSYSFGNDFPIAVFE